MRRCDWMASTGEVAALDGVRISSERATNGGGLGVDPLILGSTEGGGGAVCYVVVCGMCRSL